MTDAAAFAPHFTPAMPERPEDWLPVWRVFVDKPAQNPLNGWPKQAFDDPAALAMLACQSTVVDGLTTDSEFFEGVGQHSKPVDREVFMKLERKLPQ